VSTGIWSESLGCGDLVKWLNREGAESRLKASLLNFNRSWHWEQRITKKSSESNPRLQAFVEADTTASWHYLKLQEQREQELTTKRILGSAVSARHIFPSKSWMQPHTRLSTPKSTDLQVQHWGAVYISILGGSGWLNARPQTWCKRNHIIHLNTERKSSSILLNESFELESRLSHFFKTVWSHLSIKGFSDPCYSHHGWLRELRRSIFLDPADRPRILDLLVIEVKIKHHTTKVFDV